MTRDVKKYVKKCEQCIKNKTYAKPKERLVITETPEKTFKNVQIDTIGPLPKSNNGNEYIVTIICDLSKFLIAVAIPDKSAKTVARAIVEHCILLYGPLNNVLTDMGTEYKNKVFAEVCNLLKINHSTSTAYHHQTLGTVERSHKTFNEYIRSYLSQDRLDWDEWLKFFTYCYNTTPSTVHGYTPFELIFGKIANPFEFTFSKTVDPLYNIEAYDKELKFRLQIAQNRAMQAIEKYKQKNKEFYDKSSKTQTILPHDMVYLENDAGHKLDHVYKGPYEVMQVDNFGNCELKINEKLVKVHKNRLRVAFKQN